MAVYTKISSKDINLINYKFNIDKIKSFQGIKKGIENTNYLLQTKKEKFILTIFEKRVSNKEIPFFMKLMDNLNQSKISCPKPLKDKKWSKEIPEYSIEIDGVKFKSLTKEQYELLYRLKGST